AVRLEWLYLLERVAERGRGLGELTTLEPGPTLPRVHEADGSHAAALPPRAHHRLPDAQRLFAVRQPEHAAGDNRHEPGVRGDERTARRRLERERGALICGAASARPAPGGHHAQALAAEPRLDRAAADARQPVSGAGYVCTEGAREQRERLHRP